MPSKKEKARNAKEWSLSSINFLNKGTDVNHAVKPMEDLYLEEEYYQLAKKAFESANKEKDRKNNIMTIVMTHLSIETFVNKLAIEISRIDSTFKLEQHLGKGGDLIETKAFKYPEILSKKNFDKSGELWNNLKKLFDDRNYLIHAKSIINYDKGDIIPLSLKVDNTEELSNRFTIAKKYVHYVLYDLGVLKELDGRFHNIYDFTSDNPVRTPKGILITSTPVS